MIGMMSDMRVPKKMKCPVCGSLNHRVVETTGGQNGTYRRRRRCTICNVPFYTVEMTEARYKQLLKAEEDMKRVSSIVRSYL